jgi:Bacterial PH domain
MSVAVAVLGARALLIRVVADEHGVRLVNIFSSRYHVWDSIDRFELSRGTTAMLVTKTGKRRRLAHLMVSPAERRRGGSNHTQEMVEALQQLLRDAAPVNE